jgi:hypothetical protein
MCWFRSSVDFCWVFVLVRAQARSVGSFRRFREARESFRSGLRKLKVVGCRVGACNRKERNKVGVLRNNLVAAFFNICAYILSSPMRIVECLWRIGGCLGRIGGMLVANREVLVAQRRVLVTNRGVLMADRGVLVASREVLMANSNLVLYLGTNLCGDHGNARGE